MSRIGKREIDVPAGVTVKEEGGTVTVKGTKGELSLQMNPGFSVAIEGGRAEVRQSNKSRQARSLHGLYRTLVANMIEGVSQGFSRRLEIEGVGFKAELKGQALFLSLGFASPVSFEIPDGVNVAVDGGTKLVVSGADKQMVGQTASMIRSFAPAEPYKGKGVKYENERVRRKVGKTVA